MNTVVSRYTHRLEKGFLFFTLLIALYISIRFFYTGSTSKIFLLWNILLAWIPIFAIRYVHKNIPPYVNILLIFTWFIFFPNTLYLITDLKHLNHNLPFLEYWLDLITLCLTASIGLVLAVYALYRGHTKIQEVFSKKIALCTITALIILSGFGVYLGRFPRLNSWHIVTQPQDVFHIIGNTFQTLYDRPEQLFFVGLFSFTTGILYSIFVYVKK